MGLRFNVNEANLIGRLVSGNATDFFKDMLYSEENYKNNFDCLLEFLNDFKSNFYTTRKENFNLNEIETICEELMEIYSNFIYSDVFNKSLLNINENIDDSYFIQDNNLQIIFANLYKLSKFFNQFTYKCLIIPGHEYSDISSYLISAKLLKELISYHPTDSCLIMQIKEPITSNLYVYNTFKPIKKILENSEKLPAILVWNAWRSVLIPLNGDKENVKALLLNVFDIIHKYQLQIGNWRDRNIYSLNAMKELEEYYYKFAIDNIVYFLHISDLHFGKSTKIDYERRDRLIKCISDKARDIGSEKIYTIITGDLVDGPQKYEQPTFKDFLEILKSKVKIRNPICVLGNHDLKVSGHLPKISVNNEFLRTYRDGLIDLDNKVEVLEDIKTIIIKIDSNMFTDINNLVSVAKGRIGNEQLSMIIRELDLKVPNHNLYNKIAILHHHPVKIREKDFENKSFFHRLGIMVLDIGLKLEDSDLFLNWAKINNIRYIMHGHKHIACNKQEREINIIAAGCATGVGRDYITFNLISYDVKTQKMLSMVTYYYKDTDPNPHIVKNDIG